MTKFNSSYIGLRKDLLIHIKGKENIVLDVGCATGINGKYLIDKKIASQVYGIEYAHQMIDVALKNNIKVFQADLNDTASRNKILSDLPMFDYIICGDILEHLYNPDKVLLDLTKKLKPTGKLIVSLPNIAHIELFIQIYIKGTWPLNERGIFDKTHLRWFTKKDAFKLIQSSKLKVCDYYPILRARDAIGSEFNWNLKLVKFFNIEWVTFQHVLICTHAK